jgi:hypothetical protein
MANSPRSRYRGPPVDDSDDSPAKVNVRAFSALARSAMLGLGALGLINAGYLAYHLCDDVVEGTENAPPLVVALGLVLFTGVPWAIARLMGHLAKGTLELAGEHLVLVLRSARYEPRGVRAGQSRLMATER